MEQVMGIEPMTVVWKTTVLPLNYTCKLITVLYGLLKNTLDKTNE